MISLPSRSLVISLNSVGEPKFPGDGSGATVGSALLARYISVSVRLKETADVRIDAQEARNPASRAVPAWTRDEDAGAAAPLCQRQLVGGPLSGRVRDGGVRARLLLGRRAQVLGSAGGMDDRRRLRRRLDPEPDLRRGVRRPDRAHRSRARRLRSEAGQL